MSDSGNFIKTVGWPFFLTQVILLIEIGTLSVPSVAESWSQFRWLRIGGILPYYLFPIIIMIIFTSRLIIVSYRRENMTNALYFIFSMIFAILMFTWSWIIDETTWKDAKPYPLVNYVLHDQVWFILAGIFVIFLYLHLEFQTNIFPPLSRSVITLGSVSPVVLVGLASLLSTKDYLSEPVLGILSKSLFFIGGLLFVAAFGTVSFYRSLRNYKLIGQDVNAQVQFASFAGITEGIILYAVDSIVPGIVNVQFVLIVVTFLLPLLIIYGRNPNYITTLATPIYEVLVINETGLTPFSYNFHNIGENNPDAYLKGGAITAIFSVFNEISGTDSFFNEVSLQDRAFIVQKFRSKDEQIWMVGLIVSRSSYYLRKSLENFTKTLKDKLTEWRSKDEQSGAVIELPDEAKDIVINSFG